MSRAYISAKVTRVERAGRAPYNFVPVPEGEWFKTAEPPKLDETAKNRWDGEIVLEWEALTKFYIRGMVSYPDFCRRAGQGEEKIQTDEPFQAYGEVLLPGTSQRGMFRNMVEIMGRAPLDPINDDQLFFRAVAADPNPKNRSFEPHARAYKDRFVDKFGPRMLAGYLTGDIDDEQWYIEPASEDPASQQTFYKTLSTQEWVKPGEVTFRVDSGEAVDVRFAGSGPETGTLVCSGMIKGKTHQHVIREIDPNPGLRVKIPDVDVIAYLAGGISQTLAKKRDFVFSRASKRQACFFVEWTDPTGADRVSFGHTPYFQIPYQNTIPAVVPKGYRRGARPPEDWDLAQALFGRLADDKIPGSRGRVQFFDAHPDPKTPPRYPDQAIDVVLGTPKPTTYQHYVVQPSENIAQMHHWDGDLDLLGEPMVRGHKLYWHRPGAPPSQGGKDKVVTQLRPVEAGPKFTSKVRFENLSPLELGCLLCAIELPEGCAHHLGLGKPLGYGSFRVKIAELRLTNRKNRYAALVGENGGWHHGRTRPLDENLIRGFRSEFLSRMVLAKADYPQLVERFWNDPRMQELKALLTFDAVKQIPNWIERTRYLTIPRNRGEENEYLKPTLRRPLPPATQVLSDDPKVPDSPRLIVDASPPRTGGRFHGR